MEDQTRSDTDNFHFCRQKMKNKLGMQLEISEFTPDLSGEMSNRLGTLIEFS